MDPNTRPCLDILVCQEEFVDFVARFENQVEWVNSFGRLTESRGYMGLNISSNLRRVLFEEDRDIVINYYYDDNEIAWSTPADATRSVISYSEFIKQHLRYAD